MQKHRDEAKQLVLRYQSKSDHGTTSPFFLSPFLSLSLSLSLVLCRSLLAQAICARSLSLTPSLSINDNTAFTFSHTTRHPSALLSHAAVPAPPFRLLRSSLPQTSARS